MPRRQMSVVKLQEHFTDLKKLVNGKSLLMGEKNVQKRLIRLGQILPGFPGQRPGLQRLAEPEFPH